MSQYKRPISDVRNNPIRANEEARMRGEENAQYISDDDEANHPNRADNNIVLHNSPGRQQPLNDIDHPIYIV